MKPASQAAPEGGSEVRSALFLVASDPLASPRPAEAVRMAAGLAVWHKIQVRVYFHTGALRALAAAPGQVKDEDCFRQFLPVLVEADPGALLASDQAGVGELDTGTNQVRLRKISGPGLAELASRSNWVLRF